MNEKIMCKYLYLKMTTQYFLTGKMIK